MSKAHFAQRNFTGPELMNILSFGTREPHLLSKRQRVNRLYMASVRTCTEVFLLEDVRDSKAFHSHLFKVKRDFRMMKKMNETEAEFAALLQKWQDFVLNHFDVNGLFPDNRPYSLNACKYYVYSDEMMMNDPFGYYKMERPVFGISKPGNMIFAPDLPWIDDMWAIQDLEKGSTFTLGMTKRKDM